MEIPRLHPDTIEEVKQRIDIIDIISENVVLKKRGRDYLGLCPFHDEKTPSFSVSPSKQLYYCFGCGAGGNGITFLKEINQSSFSEVVLDLAKRYQISIKTLETQQRQELQRQISLREQLYEIVAIANKFYHHALSQPQGEFALNYLKTARQLDDTTIKQWQLGYAPKGWETLYHYLVEVKRYSVALVAQVGLIKERKSGNGYYDTFRDRLMIPIWDSQGRVIAFGSRTLGDDQPKYLNSPETPLFDKSKTLFALDKAKREIAKQDQAVVVEGYFDAIALHSKGITNAVASLGTAFTQAQLKQLLRYTESKQVVLNFDADAAGTKATQRAITDIENLVYAGQVQLRVLNLPGGKDADEFINSSASATQTYRQLLLDAPLWLDWQLQQLLVGKNLNQADEFQFVAKEMVKLLRRLEDSNQRTHYISYCAQLLAQGDTSLFKLQLENLQSQLTRIHKSVVKIQRKESSQKVAPSPSPESSPSPPNNYPPLSPGKTNDKLTSIEALLLRIYIHCPLHRQGIFQLLENKKPPFSLASYCWLWEQILSFTRTEISKLSGENLVSRLQNLGEEYPEEISQVSHLFALDEKKKEDIVRTSLSIRSAMVKMELVELENEQRTLVKKWQKLEPVKNKELGSQYSQKLLYMYQRMKELEGLKRVSLQELTEDN